MAVHPPLLPPLPPDIPPAPPIGPGSFQGARLGEHGALSDGKPLVDHRISNAHKTPV